MTAENKNASANAEAKKGGQPPKPKGAEATASAQDDGNVNAVCVRPCVCQGAYRRIGDVLSFDQDKVNPHFKVIKNTD